ncbi:MAG: ATP-binding cassette domain-containing protein [Emcibacteraceae bacterium]|nr:ATP-binding cassette domain-containing protein [Emcibacteraceae bacterium]MDG1858464.1 ATP-binding cassette domain-containing protein [Emcibacteraceae bacterium]
MNNDVALQLEELSYSHEKGKALYDTTLDIHKGKTTVILGPNGAGKSILLKLCHGLLKPESGQIIHPSKNQKSAMVFPKPVFLRRSVIENLTYVLDSSDSENEDQEEIARDALNKFSMETFADQPARSLSSGEKQRLSLIRALLLKPEILFLDEPTANLDPRATALLESMIGTSRESDMTIVMATHDLMQARRIAENIIFIDNGKIIEVSDATSFFENTQSTEAKNFLSGKL